MKMNWRKLLEKAKKLRENGKTLEYACKKTGISTNSFWRWNNGQVPVRGMR